MKTKSVEELQAEVQDLQRRLDATVKEMTSRERALEEKQAQLAAILDYSPALISIKDTSGKVVLANSNFSLLDGPSPEEFVGRNVYDLFPFEIADQLWQNDLAALQSEKPIEVEERVKHKDGNFHTYLTVKFPLYKDDQQEPFGICAISTDITARKELEAQLRQAQKMEAIGVLTGGIAHEFNNLLSPIVGYSDMLLTDRVPADDGRECLREIYRAADRAKDLIRQMLTYGRRSSERKEPTCMATVVEEAVSMFSRTAPANIAVQTSLGEGLPATSGVANELHQVVLNLCINASHAMPDGGGLSLSLAVTNDHVWVAADGHEHAGSFLKLVVEDTGTGISEDHLACIFDPFFTTKEVGRGSGLGLSVVGGIVDRHGGHVTVASKLGEGTAFTVYLPVCDEKAVSASGLPRRTGGGSGRVLLIDDDRMITDVALRMLKRLGYAGKAFGDCAGAIAHFAGHSDDFDLVITDYGMPTLNGREVAAELLAIRKDIPIVLCSAYGDLGARAEFDSWGFADWLRKPFTMEELDACVRRTIRR